MQTSTETIVKTEFEALLARCAAAGVPENDIRSTLVNLLSRDVLRTWQEGERTRAAQEAQTSKGQLLQRAFELHLDMEKLQAVGVKPDPAPFNAACLQYLQEAHGVKPGDTVEVYGWAKPRTIRLRSFRLSFYRAENANDAFMWFEGEGLRNCPAKRTSDDHGCPLGSAVYKV